MYTEWIILSQRKEIKKIGLIPKAVHRISQGLEIRILDVRKTENEENIPTGVPICLKMHGNNATLPRALSIPLSVSPKPCHSAQNHRLEVDGPGLLPRRYPLGVQSTESDDNTHYMLHGILVLFLIPLAFGRT